MTLQEKYKDYKIILASHSPRRQELFKGLGLDFEVLVTGVDESYSDKLSDEGIAIYLAELKANSIDINKYPDKTLIITSDTIVCFDEHVLNKPKDKEDAERMLHLLSGRMHQVITGICLRTKANEVYRRDHFV